MTGLESAAANTLLKALLVCLESGANEQVREALQTMRIETEVCSDPQLAMRRIGRDKLDALFLDWHHRERAVEVLQFARHCPLNRTIVVFVLTQEGSQGGDAFRSGAHFVIDGPLSKPLLLRALRAAYGLILRERRRYLRYPIKMQVLLSNADGREMETSSVNLSERGMSIHPTEELRIGSEVSLRFQLPGDSDFMRLKAQICWADGRRRAGLQFMSMPGACLEKLQDWMGHCA